MAITSVAFSPDSNKVLTGSQDKTARLWNLDGTVMQVFRGHEMDITSVAFSLNGNNILTGSNDKSARLWEIKKSPKEFRASDKYEELTVAQKIQYGILVYSDVKNLNDEATISDAAAYYINEINHVGKDKKSDYINNALNLYDILINKYNKTRYIKRTDSLLILLR